MKNTIYRQIHRSPIMLAISCIAVSGCVFFGGCASDDENEALSLQENAASAQADQDARSSDADSDSSTKSGDSDMRPQNSEYGHLIADSPFSDLVDSPAFEVKGMRAGRLLLPWYGDREDLSTRFRDVGSYMPYHSAFDTASMLAAVNRLIDEAAKGEQVFYPVYSEDEMRKDPSKRDVGLFFFRGKEDAPFAIVSPGGGFSYVGSLHESLPHAYELSNLGYNAFSLSYRAGSGDLAAQDLAAAVKFVFDHANELKVSTSDYSLWGSSAGACMASAVGTYGTAAFGEGDYPRPAAIIMAYTGQPSFTKNDPPTFSVVGDRDGIAPAQVMEKCIRGLKSAGVPAEIEVFPGVGHGFGLGVGTSAEGWIDDAVDFWKCNSN